MSHQYVVFVSNFLWSNHTKMDYWLSFMDQNRFEWIRNSMSKFLLNMIDSCLTSKYFHWIFHWNAYFQILFSFDKRISKRKEKKTMFFKLWEKEKIFYVLKFIDLKIIPFWNAINFYWIIYYWAVKLFKTLNVLTKCHLHR